MSSPLSENFLISIIGPTAVGKTALAIQLAQYFKTEILSADSRQFYKELSIGTAKPDAIELAAAPHHFINHLSIAEDYNASDYEAEAISLLKKLFENYNTLILCGGSGMYLDAVNQGFDAEVPSSDEQIRKELNELMAREGITALQSKLKELDPIFYQKVDLHNSKRLLRALEVCLISGKPYSEIRKGKGKERPFKKLKIGLNMDREKLYERINLRVDRMIDAGLLEEVKAVWPFREKNALKTVGYRELFDYLDGRLTFEQAVEKIKINSRRYAKRQLTWFKRDDEIHWFEPSQFTEIAKFVADKTKPYEQS
ncbi:MAG: tRNA (adenosine(37)-N6)-dimethylallyltransferase MiaA [Vicingaceae bacterium]